MALKLAPFGLAKRVNPISVPYVIDCSYVAKVESSPTLDLPQLGGFFGSFTHIGPANALNLKQSYLLKRPQSLSFPGLPLADPQPQLIRINPLEIPARDSIELIPEAGLLADNLLFDTAAVASDALDDGLAFFEIKILSEGFLLAYAKVVSRALDEGPALGSVTIITNPLNVAATLSATKVLKDPLDDGLTFPRVEVVDVLDYGLLFDKPTILEFVNFLQDPEIIAPFKLMARSRTLGRDYRSRYALEEDEQVGPQLRLPGPVSECRHGRLRSKCPACRNLPKKPTQKRPQRQPQVVDVFEQLFYILQPPILPPSGPIILFPNGKKPYPFQVRGVKWLVEHESALLADEMGLGKTIQAIIAIRILFRCGELQRTLVVCPASVTYNWEREIRSWAPELRVFRIQGDRSTRSEAWKSHAEIYVVSYETLRNDIQEFDPANFNMCVLDEAQKIKNPNTRVHKAVERLMPKYRWALTGTPMENNEADVVALFSFIKPGLFDEGNVDWRTRKEEIGRKITPYKKRRTINEVGIDMPELTHKDHWLDLLPEQRRNYDATENQEVDTLRRMGIAATRMDILSLITKLKQICNYDVLSGQGCKLDSLQDELEDLVANKDKALVFSQYPYKTLKKIEPKLQQFKPLTYGGSLSASKRDEVVYKFQEFDDNEVLLMSLMAGGTGITLTRANHVFLYDHWWNPAIMSQAGARVYRIGQKKPVFIHSLYAKDTIEERIVALLNKKRAAFDDIFGKKPTAADKDLEKLTDRDLFGLFDLDPPDGPLQQQPTQPLDEQRTLYQPPPSRPNGDFSPEIPAFQAERKWPSNLLKLSPTEFEEAILDLFYWWKGYLLHTTPASNDGGIDLDGFRQYGSQGRVMIQCKRYIGTVSVGQAREFGGAVASGGNVAESYIVTTGKFSNKAIRYARRMNITLINGVELNHLWSEFLHHS